MNIQDHIHKVNSRRLEHLIDLWSYELIVFMHACMHVVGNWTLDPKKAN